MLLDGDAQALDMTFLEDYDCVVLTETDLKTTSAVNNYCRSKQIMFIMANVVGLAGWCFVDLADGFKVTDTNGEEPNEQFIGRLAVEDGLVVVHTIDSRRHDLETGDHVLLSEIDGLNGKTFKIEVHDSSSFSLANCAVENLDSFEQGGVFRKFKVPTTFEFKAFDEQLYNPDLIITDYAQLSMPYYLHASMIAITETPTSFESFLTQAESALSKLNDKARFERLENATQIFQTIYSTAKAKFPPLCAFFGGVVAQEALKSLTNKFTPIKQWLHFDCIDLYEHDQEPVRKQDRYDVLRICLGSDAVVQKIQNSKVFMVGCGAIGCEMLKNLALLGSACAEGLVTITDNDLIEKSNLNRQFLFRPRDIRKPKSQTAADSIVKINPDMKIKVFQEKVCPQTEKETFTDSFFVDQDVCLNALDNVEARRYMDSRCVTNQVALLESGTLGTKGHVQTIIPHLSESYTTQQDPTDESVPYCTLKSFPSSIEHCIQWARDKFESSFTIKPTNFRKFLIDNTSVATTLVSLETQPNTVIDGSVQIAKIMRDFCFDWNDCVRLARVKFEKYFSNKAKNLLHAYPLDHKIDESTVFWKLPKRPPHAIKFNVDDDMHVRFVMSCARLHANVYGVSVPTGNVKQVLNEFEANVPCWRPSTAKKIITDEKMSKEEIAKNCNQSTEYDNLKCAELIKRVFDRLQSTPELNCLHFEKDDDSNGHVDFIHAAANLRASMYSIDPSDRLKVKRIAGKIVPAIATTTACIAGFVSIEFVKVIKREENLARHKNLFINLGLSLILVSEPGPCQRTQITETCSVTLWDKWRINGHKALTLQQFIAKLKDKYKLTASGIMNGSKVVWLPVMPGHAKRLAEPMAKLIKGPVGVNTLTTNDYVDLSITYAECDNIDHGNRNSLCPPVRYYFL